MQTSNPLLNNAGLPAWELIRAEHVEPAVTAMLANCEAALNRIEREAANCQDAVSVWNQVCTPLEDINQAVHRTWGPVRHLNSVMNTPELRVAYEKMQPAVVAFGLRLSQSEPIFRALKTSHVHGWSQLDSAQQRIIDKQILGAELSGVGLSGESKERFNAIEKQLSALSTRFSNNVLDATKAWELVLSSPEEADGLPEHILQLASQSWNSAKSEKADWQKGPWRITLDVPSMGPFMEYSTRRDLREKVWRANITTASDGTNDNTGLIKEILRLRREKAALLGRSNYAQLSLASKMAPGVDAVRTLLEDLATRSKPAAIREMDEMRAFAKAEGCTYELTDWDIPFWAKRMQEKKLGLREEELLPYFPMPVVLDGLFKLVHRLFGVSVEDATDSVTKWHPDVRFYRVKDETGQEVAAFWFDAYSRPANKRGGAWMDRCVDRRVVKDPVTGKTSKTIPVAYLTCNGTPPVGARPSLMTFGEAETLFHEFGHGLQHMLTQVDYSEASGIRNIEWDAVELPSQFMENWLYDRPTLRSVTKHVDTGVQIPEALMDKIIQGKTFRAAWMMLRQLQFALTDLELHDRWDPSSDESPFDVESRIVKRVSVLPPRPENRFLCKFGHIFAGGYAAGYYSYKWAEVLSADAFGAFEDVGLSNDDAVKKTGRRFRDTVLAMGGSRPPMEVFKQFRGREPSPDALLRHNGLS